MICARDDVKFFVFAGEFGEFVFAEVEGVGIFAVDEEDWRLDIGGVFEHRRVEEIEFGSGIESVRGIERAFVVAARRFVVVVVVFDELRCIVGQWVYDAADALVGAVFGVECALLGVLIADGVSAFKRECRVEVAVRSDAMHIVHGGGDDGFNARIHGSGIEGESAPAANAEDADFIGIDVVARDEVIDGGAEIFGADIDGDGVSDIAAAFARERGIESDGEETVFGERLGIAPGGLFFDGAEGTADGDSREFSGFIFGHIEIGGDGNAETIFEDDFLVIDFIALREGFIPFFGERGSRIECGGIGSCGWGRRCRSRGRYGRDGAVV